MTGGYYKTKGYQILVGCTGIDEWVLYLGNFCS